MRTVVESRSAPVAGLQLDGATSYNDTMRHGIISRRDQRFYTGDMARKGVLLLYRNGTLTPIYTLPPYVSVGPRRQIQMDGPQDAWVTARTFTAQGAFSGWLLLHCPFTSCSRSSLLDDARIQSSDVVQVFSPNDGWAFRMSQPASSFPKASWYTIFRLRNGQWQRMPQSFQLYTGGFFDIEQVTPDEYWVCAHTVLLHFIDGTWSMYS